MLARISEARSRERHRAEAAKSPTRCPSDDGAGYASRFSGLGQGLASSQGATRRDQPAAAVHGTCRESAERIRSRPIVGLYLRLAVRIGSRTVFRPDVGQAERIGSWPGLNPRRRVSASGRGSCMAESAGPPGGQRAPELGERLPGALHVGASWEPRRRRGWRGKGWRRCQNCGEDGHDGNEAAMRPGHRGLSFSQGRPNRGRDGRGGASKN